MRGTLALRARGRQDETQEVPRSSALVPQEAGDGHGSADDGSGAGVLVVIGMSLRERVLYVVHVQRVSAIESSAPAGRAGRAKVYETGGSV